MECTVTETDSFPIGFEDVDTDELDVAWPAAPKMLPEKQPHGAPGFTRDGHLWIPDKAAGNPPVRREIPGEVNILTVDKEAGIPVEVHVFKVLQNLFAIDPPRVSAVRSTGPRILDKKEETALGFLQVENGIVVITDQTEAVLFTLRKRAGANGQEHISVMESCEQAPPQQVTGNFCILQEYLLGNPARQHPQIRAGIASGKVVTTANFKVCLLDQRGPQKRRIVSVNHVEASLRIL